MVFLFLSVLILEFFVNFVGSSYRDEVTPLLGYLGSRLFPSGVRIYGTTALPELLFLSVFSSSPISAWGAFVHQLHIKRPHLFSSLATKLKFYIRVTSLLLFFYIKSVLLTSSFPRRPHLHFEFFFFFFCKAAIVSCSSSSVKGEVVNREIFVQDLPPL